MPEKTLNKYFNISRVYTDTTLTMKIILQNEIDRLSIKTNTHYNYIKIN